VFRGEQKRMRRLLVMGQPKQKPTVSVDDAKQARAKRATADRAKLVAMVS
jgi:hypothetical protein